MMMRALLASAALLAAAAPAAGQTNAAVEETPTVAPATVTATPEKRNGRQSTTGDPNRQICRTQGATGSRLGGTKVCKTAREWEEQRMASKDELDRMQTRRGLIGN